jgi:hypothetical protein
LKPLISRQRMSSKNYARLKSEAFDRPRAGSDRFALELSLIEPVLDAFDFFVLRTENKRGLARLY